MCILNGRVLGDLFGKYTCFTPRRKSTVDYAAVSPSLFKSVRYFTIGNLLPHHAPIEFAIKVRTLIRRKQSKYCLLPKPNKVVWDTQLSDKYKFMLESPDCKESFQNFINTGIMQNQSSVHSAEKFVSRQVNPRIKKL